MAENWEYSIFRTIKRGYKPQYQWLTANGSIFIHEAHRVMRRIKLNKTQISQISLLTGAIFGAAGIENEWMNAHTLMLKHRSYYSARLVTTVAVLLNPSSSAASYLTKAVLKHFDRFLSAVYHIKSILCQKAQPELIHTLGTLHFKVHCRFLRKLKDFKCALWSEKYSSC